MTMRRARLSLAPSTILGYRKDGRPIHPIAGGSEDDGAPEPEPALEPDISGGAQSNDPSFDFPRSTALADMTPEQRAEYWREKAQKHEKEWRAVKATDSAQMRRELRAAQKELDEMRQASMSETEKAINEAEQRGRSAATSELAQRLAAAEVRAALTGVVPDPAAIVEDLNLAKYVTDTGDVDQEAVTALRKKYESFAPKPSPDLKQGKQGSGAKDIDQQIAEATAAGNHALAISLKRQKAYAAT